MKDKQRKRCYDWEDEIFCVTSKPTVAFMRREQLKSVVESLSQTFLRPLGVSPIIIDPHPESTRSFGFEGKLSIIDNHLCLEFVCHELAHLVIEKILDKKDREGHGPEWLTCHMIMLIVVCGYDKDFIISTANQHRLRFYENLVEGFVHKWNTQRSTLFMHGTALAKSECGTANKMAI
ncbi:hypothetical protein EVB91_288 [Rhizobium phage RHph_I1_18]|nr:hypothetical protein EVB91_288 [Rhizobium phage RHph_I1_18]